MDLVLRNGDVIDGTGAPRARADVLVSGGRIARDVSNPRVVDCSGMVICPGFIDTHSHSDLVALVEPALPAKARQGITFDLLGQDGISVAPVRAEDEAPVRRQLAGLLGDPDVARDFRTVGTYLGRLAAAKPGIHLGYLAPHGAIRAQALGLSSEKASPDALKKMQRALEQALDEGALGLSTGLIYPPCCYADTAELVALGEVLARADRPFVAHIRSESDRIMRALDELISVGEVTGCAVHVSHIKIAGRANWPLVEEMIARIERAQKAGVRVTGDQYPYVAGSTMFGAILPPFAHDGGADACLARLRSPSDRARIKQTILADGPHEWDNFWSWTGPEGIVISDVPSGKRPELVGKTVAAAAGAGRDPLEFAIDLLESESMGVSMISFSQSEDVVERFLQLPFVNGCTDGLLGGRPHPRAYGAFPRVLGRYVRDRKSLTLEEAIRKLTSQAADTFRLKDRGRIVPGAIADLVVFDPRAIKDEATFEDPKRFPTGIAHVFVAGGLGGEVVRG
jgi:N-acyl-D-amino-acid deacylase